MFKSPLNYAGSKHDLMQQLLKHFPSPETVDVFYDVFAGGLSVSINTNYKKTIANDIIKPLIEFYYNLNTASKKDKIDEEILKIKSFSINKESQEEYLKIREEFNKTGDPYQFFALVSSCTNNMMRFNKSFKFNQSFGKRTINDSTVQKLKEYCNTLKDKDIYFCNFTYQDLFKIQPISKNDFVYLDPPYLISEAGYNSYWSRESEESLYNLLDDLDSKEIRFVMSNLKQHKGVTNPYLDRIKKYTIIELDYDYEKVARKKGSDSVEIIVKNF
jgi:site-specific DNA-adenine methylase